MSWSEFLRLAALNLGLIVGLMTVLWAVSLALRDSSIADLQGFAMWLLERRMLRKHPDFAAYARRTSGFFPLPPKRA